MKRNKHELDKKEIYRMFGVLGNITMTSIDRKRIKNYLGKEEYFKLLDSTANYYNQDFPTSVFHYFFTKDRLDLIDKFITMEFGFFNNTSTISMLNYFSTFNNELINSNLFNKELNVHIIDDDNERADLPKGSVSLLIFNSHNKKSKNVTVDLQRIIDNEILHVSKNDIDNGKVVLIMEQKELETELPFIIKHFDIYKEKSYKMNNNKTVVLFSEIRSQTLTFEEVKNEETVVKSLINENKGFDSYKYNGVINLPPVPYFEMKENQRMIENDVFKISDSSNDGWEWFREITEIKETSNNEINKATPLKVGELSNLIASGMINGEMKLEDGSGFHVVAGGMKEIIKQSLRQEENQKGHLINKTETTVYSEPYLNILINNKNGIEIKELKGESDLQ